MKKTRAKPDDELRPEYAFDYSKAARGKYAKRIAKEGTNIVVLDPDVAASFVDSVSVNAALRALIAIAEPIRKTPKPRPKRSASSTGR